jgi:cytochrome c-type biogenesis protein CcmH/NrfG
MISTIVIVIVIAGAGWLAWSRWQYWHQRTVAAPAEDHSPKARAFEAFMHGNTCLAAGQFADATTAFEQARTLDPKRPYVAERLAEVARRQHAGMAPVPVAAGG